MDDDVVLGLFPPRAEICPGKHDASSVAALVVSIPSSRVILHARLAFPRRTALRVVLVILVCGTVIVGWGAKSYLAFI